MINPAASGLHRVALSTWKMHGKRGDPPPEPKDDELATDYSARLDEWRTNR